MESMLYPKPQSQPEGFCLTDDETHDELELIEIRRQYWKLDEARKYIKSRNEGQRSDHDDVNTRPVTCLLNPGLTPSKLYDHLKSRGASDACILEWTRRLQTLRKETEKITNP